MVNLNTVSLLLILFIEFDLATKQVSYTCAFLHAEIDGKAYVGFGRQGKMF